MENYAPPQDDPNEKVGAVEERLRASEKRRRSLIDAVPDLLFWVAGDGTITDFVPAAEEGVRPYVPPEAFIGRNLLDVLPQPVAGEMLDVVQRTLSTGKIQSLEYELPMPSSNEAGGLHEVPTSFEGRAVPCLENEVVWVARDITQRRELEKLKDEFVSTISHELRTPLTSIRGALGLLEGGVVGELSPDVAEMVAIARSNADRLTSLIDDILDLQKIAARKLTLKRRRLQPLDLVTAALTPLNGSRHGASFDVVVSVEDGCHVIGDGDRLIQVLTNLLSNAMSFSPPDGIISVSVRPVPGYVRFEVQDEGPGIRPEEHNLLFRPFQQLDATDSRRHGGTGLGLSICKGVVDEHDGRIGIESELGRGSLFFFELPAPRSAGRPQA